MNEKTAKILSQLQGKEVDIFNIGLQNRAVTAVIKANGTNYYMTCTGVTEFRIDINAKVPRIRGFEVRDFGPLGYEKDMWYRVHDFEDEAIDLYCEDLEITDILIGGRT